MFDPKYRITGKIAKALISIEADRQIVATLPLTAPMLAKHTYFVPVGCATKLSTCRTVRRFGGPVIANGLGSRYLCRVSCIFPAADRLYRYE